MEEEFETERKKYGEGYSLVIGVDEAGRGPLAGPVLACAAALKGNLESGIWNLAEEKEWKLVRDSKTLSEKQRERTFEFVRGRFHVGVGIVYPETIDRMNILEATFLAMREAVGELRRILRNENAYSVIPSKAGIQTPQDDEKIPDQARNDNQKILLLVDGNQAIPNLSLPQEAVVGGDGLARSIAAASIVAKVMRDRMMIVYDGQYPAYGFAKHKGYGTADHMAALRKYGPCAIHRMSFKPVRDSTVEGINRNLRGAYRKSLR